MVVIALGKATVKIEPRLEGRIGILEARKDRSCQCPRGLARTNMSEGYIIVNLKKNDSVVVMASGVDNPVG